MRRLGVVLGLALATVAGHSTRALADLSCARPEPGSVVQAPPDLYSSHGELNVALNYVTSLDSKNRTLFCFVTDDGQESPTLHVNPGETIHIALKNLVPKPPEGAKFETMKPDKIKCGAGAMDIGSVNMHFHGTNVTPDCHSDEVIHTLVNPGQTFDYSIAIPKDEPPGLYWYHPHVHGLATAAVQGGASGAIIVEGIQNLQPKVAKLPSRVLLVRDQSLGPQRTLLPLHGVPSWDLTLNYVPISYPQNLPAQIVMQPGRSEFWRVANASAESIVDLQLKYDGVVQTLRVAALDGVATGSQDGTRRGKLMDVQDIFIPPAGRAEFIVPPLPAGVKHATFETLHVDTGAPHGDSDPRRVLADISAGDEARGDVMPAMDMASPPGRQRFEDLDDAKVTANRHLYFYEIFPDPQDPNEGLYYIVVKGQAPQLFDPNAPPAITTKQGAVEDWVIENRATEVHEFHIHQIHFQLRAINHKLLPANERVVLDTVQVPYWSGKGPYPSVTLRMDFRGPTVGDFVYHCHILDHEDGGMMAIIRVLPRKG